MKMEKDLPLELLCHVLSYLDPLQRLSAGLVCKRWLQASATLLEDVCLTIRDRLPTLMSDRAFPRIIFISTVIDDECIDFINSLGPGLLHLKFIDCSVHAEKKVVACLRLRTLETDSGYVLLVFESLPRLLEMDVKHASDITDDMLMLFDKIVSPNLEVFSMPNATVFKGIVCRRFYPEGTTLESHPSPYILSRIALEMFVTRRATSLTSVSLPRHITPDAAVFLSRVVGLKLRSVSFAECDEDITNIVPEFYRNQPGIVVLDFCYAKFTSDNHVAGICDLLPALRDFSARGCPLDWGVIPLFRLRHLRALCLNGCLAITPVAFIAAIPATPLLGLRKLDLGLTRIEDSQIHALLSNTPRLVELNLSCCDISNSTLADVVCLQLTRLRALDLSGCEGVSDEGLCRIHNLTRLVSLDLRNCRGLTSVGIIASISFKHLKELDLRGCHKVTSSVLAPLRSHNPCLTELQVS